MAIVKYKLQNPVTNHKIDPKLMVNEENCKNSCKVKVSYSIQKHWAKEAPVFTEN